MAVSWIAAHDWTRGSALGVELRGCRILVHVGLIASVRLTCGIRDHRRADVV